MTQSELIKKLREKFGELKEEVEKMEKSTYLDPKIIPLSSS